MGILNGAANPNALVNQMLSNNPNYAKAQELISQNGGDAKAAFYNLARQNGIDPEEVLRALR